MRTVNPSTGYIDRSRAQQLVEKWSPVLDYSSNKVKAIENEHDRLTTAILMENQERWCIEEAGNTAGSGGVFGGPSGSNGALYNPPGGITSGDNYAPGDSRLPKILIPMVRRTFPELITNEIVGVQPMSGPVGLAFALRYRYEANSLAGNGVDGIASTGSAQTYGPGTTGNGQGYDRSVDEGNSSNPNSGGKYAEQFPLGSGNYTGKNAELGYQYLDTRFTGTSSSQLSGAADSSVFQILDSDQGVAAILSNYELTGNIPQIVVEFSKTAVEAGTRRLAARWSVELEQDLKNMNGLDIDSELTNAMSYEIQAEIDREMIIRMTQVCLNAGPVNGYTFWYAQSADARWLGERNRDFYSKIIVEANRIAIRNRRGSANFIIATPRVCAILEMLPEFQWMPVNGNVNTQPTGIAKVGTLGGRFQVYRDTRTDAQFLAGYRSSELEYALLGYKGTEYYDTGIVYCPYIPVMIQRTIGPNDFAPRVGLMTRYGVVDHIFGANLYYHIIIVRGLTSYTYTSGGGFATGANGFIGNAAGQVSYL
jgi:Major capsid protein Gp23